MFDHTVIKLVRRSRNNLPERKTTGLKKRKVRPIQTRPKVTGRALPRRRLKTNKYQEYKMKMKYFRDIND